MVKINDMSKDELYRLLLSIEGYVKDSITSVCYLHKPETVVHDISMLEKLRRSIIIDNMENQNEGCL